MRSSLSIFRASVLLALGVSATACGGDSEDAGTLRPCTESTPLPTDPSLSQCTEGPVHRTAANECSSSLPRPDACTSSGTTPQCATDADCTANPHGYCQQEPQVGNCSCNYGCVKDADCGDGKACLCGSPVGYCVEAKCRTDADCGGGALCVQTRIQKCGSMGLACQKPGDQCSTDSDCQGGQLCALDAGVRKCLANDCPVPGRPFFVGGAPRVAAISERGDWLDAACPVTFDLSADVRAELAAHWGRVGQMEHASVAAFARFTLQLLALGAPASLVEESQIAMADELRHARLCFGLATAYAGVAQGPDALDVSGALGPEDVANIVRSTFLEGCVGESAAAHEARVSAGLARDPEVRRGLEGISADEERHALTAWKTVRWALAEFGAVARGALLEEIALLEREASAPRAGSSPLAAHGVLAEPARLALRTEVVREVVLPCARALVGVEPLASARAA